MLSKVYIPMSKSTIATVALFFAVSRWNGYFWARQMISNPNEHPLQVFIPMSKSTIATVALFFAVSRWNGYFWARQMISNQNEQPLQVYIRNKLEELTLSENMAAWNKSYAADSVIFALIVCSIIPILVIYPFIQKYFAKGTNAGGVKE